jgi:Zn-dependent peptidase ImmA (M78 family)
LIDFPEINFAKRLVERDNLKPPIDVFELTKKFARIKRVRFPVDVDGICLNLKHSNKVPTIIINRGKGEMRQRFTLAHELGHVLIPWHTGTIVDEIDVYSHDLSVGYWALEAEANRFASELLMPSNWVLNKIQRDSLNPGDFTRDVATLANVSLQAATIKVINFLPPGYIFAHVENDVVTLSGRSPGTLANAPAVGKWISPDAVFPWIRPQRQQLGGTAFYWWQFTGDVPLPTGANGDWRELLEEILTQSRVPPDQIAKFKSSLNGIIAGANGQIRENRTIESIYEACLQRLHSRAPEISLLRRVIAHPKFSIFLVAKVSNMLAK